MKGNGDVSSLNFEVILNDDKFSEKIKKDIENAKTLNKEITRLLSLQGKLNTDTTRQIVNSEKVAKAAAKTAQEKAKQAIQEEKLRAQVEKTAAAQQKQSAAVSTTNARLLTTSTLMRTISQLTGITFGAVAIRRFVSSMIEITGQFELQKVALKTILRDAEGAEKIFEQLYKFSSDSMYRFSELAKHAKQLAAFGIGQDNLLETTKMLGDVAAGLGVSMDRLILAYGHVKSSGFLRGIQLRSFSQNGVPILDELAKMMTEVEGRAVSLGEVFDRMTKRQIDFAMVEEAFRRMTDEGGQFHNIQEQMARTLAGEINVLKGRWENLMYAMGEQTEGFVLTIVRAISESISSLEKFKDTMSDLWDAGSPVWKLYSELRAWIGEADRNKGRGGNTDINGGGYAEGFGVGGGSRGGGLDEQVEAYLKISNIVSTIKAEEAEIARLRKKAVNEGLSMGLTGGIDETKELQAAIDARDEALKQYKDIMGVDYYKKTGSGGRSVAEQARRERINDLKTEANFLKKLADAYAKLEPYLGEKTNAKMVEIFGAGDYSRASIEASVTGITDALRELGKEGAEAAESIEQSWGLDQVSKAVKQLEADKKAADEAQKSLDKYLETMQNWMDKNQELTGTGAAYSISKAIGNYNKAVSEARKTERKALGELLGGTTDKGKRLLGLSDIREQSALSKANALVTLRNEISKYADDIFKEQLGGYDLSNWGDKTLSQINDIRVAVGRIEIPDEIKEILKDYPELLSILETELEKIKQSKVANTIDPERFKKIAGYANKVSGYFSKAADALRGLADASGNSKLAESAEILGILAQNMQAAADGAEAWGGWWGAIIGGVSDLIDQAVSGFTEAIEKAKELAKTIRQIQDDAWIESNTSLFSNKSIFGDETAKNLRGAVEAMDRIREDMEVIGDPNITRNGTSFWEKLSIGWRVLHNPEHIAPEEFIPQGTLSEVMQRYGLNMYDDNGILDPKSIRKVIEMFGDTDGVLERLAKDAEAYAEAMKVVEDTAQALVGDVVSDVADKIVDSWFEAGEAALDYADILEDVAKGYAKLIVQDMLMDAAFDEDRRQQFVDALKRGDPQTAMATVASAMQAAEDMLPTVEQALQVFEPYRNMSGGSSNSVGAGIKGITEDTANLLASYINAIRADVSHIRVMHERGMASIDALGQSLPTLNEYLAQVSANTYDTAQNTSRILSELQSVIGAPGTSGMVVRVEYA